MDSIMESNKFFIRFIDMIPKDLYKAPEDSDVEHSMDTKYHKHRKLPLPVNERKLISSKNKKHKFTPEEVGT